MYTHSAFSLVVAAAASQVPGPLNPPTKEVCPVDGTRFTVQRPFFRAPTLFGSDLRPLDGQPPHHAECPKCHYVLGGFVRDEDVPRIRKLVGSSEFRRSASHAPGYRQALQREATGASGWQLCRLFLEASWEEQPRSALWSETTARLLACLEGLTDPGPQGGSYENEGIFETSRILMVDVLRQRGEPTRALAIIDAMGGHSLFLNEPYKTMLQWERGLIASGSVRVENVPALPVPGRDDSPPMRLATSLPGAELAMKRLRIEHASVGAVNMAPESLFLQLVSAEQRLVDQAWWYNTLVDQKPGTDWHGFLTVFDAAENTAKSQAWLVDWKNGAPNRHVELWALGGSGHALAGVEKELDMVAWKHAEFPGEPGYQLVLREGDITSVRKQGARPSTPPHWVDGLDLFYHPRGDGLYIRVVSGTWEFRHATVGKEGRP